MWLNNLTYAEIGKGLSSKEPIHAETDVPLGHNMSHIKVYENEIK